MRGRSVEALNPARLYARYLNGEGQQIRNLAASLPSGRGDVAHGLGDRGRQALLADVEQVRRVGGSVVIAGAGGLHAKRRGASIDASHRTGGASRPPN